MKTWWEIEMPKLLLGIVLLFVTSRPDGVYPFKPTLASNDTYDTTRQRCRAFEDNYRRKGIMEITEVYCYISPNQP